MIYNREAETVAVLYALSLRFPLCSTILHLHCLLFLDRQQQDSNMEREGDNSRESEKVNDASEGVLVCNCMCQLLDGRTNA
jgi:hypothetical protein